MMIQKTKKITIEDRFKIDAEGLRIQMLEVEPFRVVQEIVANGFDENSAKNISVDFKRINANDVKVTIINDGHEFEDKRDIYTLFKYSKKRQDTKQRGRFNLGEKQFFALAIRGYVETGFWHVEFTETKRRDTELVEKYDKVKVVGVFEWNGEVVRQILIQLHKLLVPNDKELLINGTLVRKRTLARTLKGELFTLIENDEDKKLHRIKKMIDVELYELGDNEEPRLFEMGVPIQTLAEKINWDINITEKVPLPTGRNMVTDSYLKDLYGIILNGAVDLIPDDDAGRVYVQIGMKSATKETAQAVLTKRYGDTEMFIKSTTDWTANEKVLDNGGDFLRTGDYDAEVRNRLQDYDLVKKAGDTYGTNAFETAKPVEPTEQMLKYAEIVKAVAKDVIHEDITVSFVTTKLTQEGADWLGNSLTYNVRNVGGKSFFNSFTPDGVRIIIHEFAHRVGVVNGIAHYSNEYLRELEKIAGKIGYQGIQYWVDEVDNS